MWKIAVVQDDFNFNNKQIALEQMVSHIKKCLSKHPQTKLILFPELTLNGYDISGNVSDFAEWKEGPSYQYIKEVARQYRIYIGYGFVESDRGGKLYNSVNLVSPTGQRIATYQKIHLTPLEKHLFSPGESLVTVETEVGKLGILICWDMAFPELTRLLSLQEIDILLAPSAWESPHEWSYSQMASSRAIDNTIFVATCNLVGDAGDLNFFGQSAIYQPDGKVISGEKHSMAGVITAPIDLSLIESLKKKFYSMKDDQRNDLYSISWKGK